MTLPAASLPFCVFVFAACAASGAPASGQPGTTADAAGPCIDDEPRLIHYARRLVSDPDPRLDALRRRYHLEDVEAADVRQVTDPVICAQAGSAYANAVDLVHPPDAVAVIRIGDRYLVTSRVGGSTSSEIASAAVLDDTLRPVSVLRR